MYENFKIFSETLAKIFGLAFYLTKVEGGRGLEPDPTTGPWPGFPFNPPSTSEKISSSSDAKPNLKEKIRALCTGKVALEP
jgi:hypothetical protein